MRTDIMKWAAFRMTARDAVILVLTSDRELSSNYERTSKGTGRSVKSLKDYNPKIDHTTLYNLVKEGLVEQVGFKFRLAGRATH